MDLSWLGSALRNRKATVDVGPHAPWCHGIPVIEILSTLRNVHDLRRDTPRLATTYDELLRLVPKPGLQERGRLVVITHAEAPEAQSSVALDLATALTERGDKGILVDVDPRHVRTDISGEPGFFNMLLTRPFVLPELPQSRLRILPAGCAIDVPANAFSLEQLPFVLGRLRMFSDFVILDAPPLLRTPSLEDLIQFAEAVFLAVETGRTSISAASQAAARLKLSAASVSIVMASNRSVATRPPQTANESIDRVADPVELHRIATQPALPRQRMKVLVAPIIDFSLVVSVGAWLEGVENIREVRLADHIGDEVVYWIECDGTLGAEAIASHLSLCSSRDVTVRLLDGNLIQLELAGTSANAGAEAS